MRFLFLLLVSFQSFAGYIPVKSGERESAFYTWTLVSASPSGITGMDGAGAYVIDVATDTAIVCWGWNDGSVDSFPNITTNRCWWDISPFDSWVLKSGSAAEGAGKPEGRHVSGFIQFTYNDTAFLGCFGGDNVRNKYQEETWRSKNNANSWRLINNNVKCLERILYAVVVVNDTAIYVIGGQKYPNGEDASSGSFNDYWRSLDGGATFDSIGLAPFPAGATHGAIAVYNNKIYLLYSWFYPTDGSQRFIYNDFVYEFTPATNSWRFLGKSKIPHRGFSVTTVFDNKIFIVTGGYNSVDKWDVIWTDDGINFHLVNTLPYTGARHAPTLFVSNNTLYMICGSLSGARLNSIWKMEKL